MMRRRTATPGQTLVDRGRERVESRQEAADRKLAWRGPRLSWLWLALPLVAAIVVFAQVRDFQLLEYDDRVNIRDNPHLTPFNFRNLTRFWTRPYAGLYIPLTYSALMIEARFAEQPATGGQIDRFRPGVFHVGNLLIHLVNISLVFILLWRLVGCAGAVGIGATLFAIHPIQVESVAWATEIKGLLCGAFSLLALWQYLLATGNRARTSSGAGSIVVSDRRRYLHYGLASLALALALLSKPSAAAVPLVALLIDALVLGSQWRSIAWRLTPWFVLAAVLLIATKRLQPDETIAAYKPAVWLRPLVALDAVGFYLRKVAWPVSLGTDYGRSPLRIIRDGSIYVTWIVPIAVLIAFCVPRERRVWCACLGIVVAALAPVLGLVPFAYQDLSTVADRYAYLAMFGAALALAWWLSIHWKSWWPAGAMLSLIVLAGLAFRQTGFWRDDYTLFKHCLDQINPDSYVALNNVGVAIERSARNEPGPGRLAKLQEAARYYQRSAAIAPHFDDAQQHLAFALAQLGQFSESIAAFQRYLQLRPRSPTGHVNLANVYLRTGDNGAALAEYRRGTQLDPNYVNAWVGVGTACLKLGDRQTAETAFRRALAIDPSSDRARRGLALALGPSR